MADTEAPPATWAEDLIRDYQDKLTCGLYDAIYRLDGPSVDALMEAQARTCVGAFLELGTLKAPMSLDDFLQRIQIAGPSKIEIQREGNIIHWDEQHQGECVCPFVRRGVVRLDRHLCRCGAYWVKYLFEAVAQTAVDVDLVSSVATGSRNCSFVIKVRNTPPSRG